MSVTFYTAATEDDLNVSNCNFSRLMDLLGVDDVDGCGRFDGEALADLRARVVFTLESLAAMPALDGGVPAVDVSGTTGPRIIECGVREGYYADRLSALRAIIDAAIAGGQPLIYG